LDTLKNPFYSPADFRDIGEFVKLVSRSSREQQMHGLLRAKRGIVMWSYEAPVILRTGVNRDTCSRII